MNGATSSTRSGNGLTTSGCQVHRTRRGVRGDANRAGPDVALARMDRHSDGREHLACPWQLSGSWGGHMLIGLYRTKAELERSIGQPLHYDDRELLRAADTHLGTLVVHGPPGGSGTRWTAEVTMVAGRIVRVE